MIVDSNDPSCQCEWLTDACSEPVYEVYEGRAYCVLHLPNTAKTENFLEAIEKRLDATSASYLNFVGVWFPTAISFAQYNFKRRVDFSLARFASGVSFIESEFQEVTFADAQFQGKADFRNAQFSSTADFSRVEFKQGASFAFTLFSANTLFIGAQFAGYVDFSAVEFEQDVYFYSASFDVALFRPAYPATSSESKPNTDNKPTRTKFKNCHFSGATFKQASFYHTCFSGILQFNSTEVQEAIDFSVADFNKADFSNSVLTRPTFDGAFFLETPIFTRCELRETAIFTTARLPGIDLSGSVVDSINFTLTRFENTVAEWEAKRLHEEGFGQDLTGNPRSVVICFDNVTFRGSLVFKYNELYQDRALLSFDDAIFEKPERVRFVSVSMPPHSFMNVDPRNFHFIDVRWGFIDKRTALSEARNALSKYGRTYSPPVLELAYRQLAVNAEENNRYEQAAELRYLAMEMARSMRWRRIDWLRLSWWYWLLSGYGEKVRRAFAALLVIWASFGAIYWIWQDSTWWQIKQGGVPVVSSGPEASIAGTKPLTAPEALLYSANVMALQKPEPLPANKRAKLMVLFETILGPIQAALLALAIRRKFMR